MKSWGPESRVTVHRGERGTYFLKIDSGVQTPVFAFTGDARQLSFLTDSVLQIAYRIRHYDSAVIIGAGGGEDVLSSYLAGTKDITAVEINRTIVHLMTETDLAKFSGELYRRPGIHVHVRDGRSFVAEMNRKVDLIQLTFVDTHAAAQSGSHTLSESYLYTVEAMRDYLAHLKPGGILSVSRWARSLGSDYAETHRLIAVVQRALQDMGVKDVGAHLVTLGGPATLGPVYSKVYGRRPEISLTSTTLVKMEPFSDDELRTARNVATESGLVTLWMANGGGQDEAIRTMLTQEGSPAFFEEYARDRALDIAPITDDRPFFFTFVRPQHYFSWDRHPSWQKASKNWSYLGIKTLWQVLGTTVVLLCLLLLLPLLFRLKDLKNTPRLASTLGYFISIGLAYLGVEVCLIQRFALFLEHPVYSLVTVLASMLLFSGLGSLWTSRVSESAGLAVAARRAAVLCVILVLYSLGLSPLVQRLVEWPLAAKVALCGVILFPPSFLMGMFFPLGAKGITDRLLPWAWGLNSGFSVLSSILAMFLAVGWGYTVAWWVFTGCYVMTAVCALRLAGRASPPTVRGELAP